MDSTRKNLTNKCSVEYFDMYELLVKMAIIEEVDGDPIGDLFCSLELNERI